MDSRTGHSAYGETQTRDRLSTLEGCDDTLVTQHSTYYDKSSVDKVNIADHGARGSASGRPRAAVEVQQHGHPQLASGNNQDPHNSGHVYEREIGRGDTKFVWAIACIWHFQEWGDRRFLGVFASAKVERTYSKKKFHF